ncbi:hypothetical protein ES332_D06G180000v1 [Gossypium tomentosum]|uniref:Uncharacterized protein n=1 Tax=Gossypium tomentosum TaxID=34277 RepID=A0A5D2KJH8_GOSTO|nr:hypothetical protein ES332_D06G180000v1 [Gossypium tomentosum]
MQKIGKKRPFGLCPFDCNRKGTLKGFRGIDERRRPPTTAHVLTPGVFDPLFLPFILFYFIYHNMHDQM